MQTSIKIILMLVVSALAAGCAEPGDSIGEDGVYAGELNAGHRRMDDGSAFARHSIDLETGQQLTVTMQSNDFDSYLQIQDPRGEVLAEDDDSAGGNNARVILTAPENGEYVIVANAFQEGEYGEYTLNVSRDSSGEVIGIFRGEVRASDSKTFESVALETHSFEASAGDQIDAILTSFEFDAFLELHDAEGNLIDSDDDSGGGMNARLSVAIIEDGTYTLVPKSYGESGAGTYTLTVLRGEADPMWANAVADTLRGTLSADADRDDEGMPYVAHDIELEAGDIVDVTMSSEDFDSYLQLQMEDGSVMADDDDSGGGLNARMQSMIPVSGNYRILAKAIDTESAGDYNLRIQRASMAEQIASGEIEVFNGSLSADSDKMQDGTPFSEHMIEASAGEELEIKMSSGSFDAFLMVFDSNNNKLAEDDDSGGGSNASLLFAVPADGTYRIVANSYGSEAQGRYYITLRR